MKFSICLPTGFEGVMYPIPFVQPGDFVRLAQLCERLGYDSVWGNDHITSQHYVRDLYPDKAPAFYELMTVLSFCAAATTRIRVGTALADFADRSLGIGYTGGSLLLLGCLLATLGLWRWSQGTVSVNSVSTPKVEAFYWATITFSQTLGTALGDWLADTRGFGYERGALVFTAALLVVVALYLWTNVSRVVLFWVAFILTRPLGATVGDFLDKPVAAGGLALSRPLASAVITAIVVALIIVLPQRPGQHPTLRPPPQA